MKYADVLEKLYNLRRDKRNDYERPHKPLLILTLIDLVEAGLDAENHFQINEPLFKIWTSYFDIVKSQNDKPTVENPLFYLSGDGFWGLVARDDGGDIYRTKGTRSTPSRRWLQENSDFGQLEPEIYKFLCKPRYRTPLRKAIIGRYFPEYLHKICDLSEKTIAALSNGRVVPAETVKTEESQTARSRAFSSLVLGLYDNRCTACGWRFDIGGIKVGDAAHIVPWSKTQNDHPTNGIALCKNHHWAMDRGILVPGVDRRWHVSKRLDSRNRDHRPIIELDNQPLFAPQERVFMPAESYLKWRQDQLL